MDYTIVVTLRVMLPTLGTTTSHDKGFYESGSNNLKGVLNCLNAILFLRSFQILGRDQEVSASVKNNLSKHLKLPYPFRHISRPLSNSDLEDFESERGSCLPNSYRSFLLNTNGGYPQNEGFDYGDGKSFMLQRLYPLTDDIEPYFNLRSVNHESSDAPDGFLIIGTSSFGDAVCLGIDFPHTDKVFYLDHEERDPDKVDSTPLLGIYHLADSFETFMFSLKNTWEE